MDGCRVCGTKLQGVTRIAHLPSYGAAVHRVAILCDVLPTLAKSAPWVRVDYTALTVPVILGRVCPRCRATCHACWGAVRARRRCSCQLPGVP